MQDVAGLQHVISMTIQGDFQDGEPLPNVLFRVYKLKSYKSDQGGKRLPRIELVEIGPRLDFKIGRIHTPTQDMVTEAHKKARQLEMRAKKNVDMDIMGDKLGRIHMGKQDLGQLQTRKMKGLKPKFDQSANAEERDDEVDEDYEDEASDEGQEYEEEFVSATDIEPSNKRQKK